MTINPEPGLLWLPAFMAGLLGSGHCFAMCGGIAGGLGTMVIGKPGSQSKVEAWLGAAQFNLGRLAGYALVGGLLAGLAGLVPQVPGLEVTALALRLATALLVGLLGLQYAFGWKALGSIEKLGAKLWPRIAPLATGLARGAAKPPGKPPSGARRMLLGLCWGFLPCGLVYTMLLTATASANAFTGATVMFAFGLGTLPSMLGITLAAPALASILKDRDLRRFIGFSLVLLAAWMVFSTFNMGPVSASDGGAGHDHG